ncbi:MAG: hypothetical protein JWQ35_1281 [Bacteriovoracaceae bacterium]|nr:hypothetical protein [Bacteriovoracaceae bacterium]
MNKSLLLIFGLVLTTNYVVADDASEIKPARYMDAHFYVMRLGWQKPANEGDQPKEIQNDSVCEGEMNVPVYDWSVQSPSDRSMFWAFANCLTHIRKSWNEKREPAYFEISANAFLQDKGGKTLGANISVSPTTGDPDFAKLLTPVDEIQVGLDDTNASGVTLTQLIHGGKDYRMNGGEWLMLAVKFKEKSN